MTIKDQIAEKIIAEWTETFKSKDSPPLTAKQLEQFHWIIDRVWADAVHILCPEK
jgi:hypothetical protein